MTSKNQIRSVLMTLLMVTSVFAGVVAFSGSAAAAADEVSVGSTSVEQGGSVDVTFNSTDPQNDSVVLVASIDETFNSNEDIVLADSLDPSSSTTYTWSVGTDVPTGDYTIYAANNSSAPSDTTDLSTWSDSNSPDTVSVTAPETNNNDVLFIGETGTFTVPDPAGTYTLYSDDGEGNMDFESDLDNEGGVITVDTSGKETGTYRISTSADSADAVASFQLAEHELSASFDSENVTVGSNTTLNLDSNRNGYPVEVTASGLNNDEIATIFEANGDIEGEENDDGNYQFTVSNQDAEINLGIGDDVSTGQYDFEFNAADTDASASAQLNVSEAGSESASFQPNVVSEHVGDVAAITVNLENTDTANITIGSQEDVSYELDATIEDVDGDGQVTVLYNTYLTGNETDGVVSSLDNSDDRVTLNSETNLTNPVAPGDYPLNITSSSTDEELNVGTLVLNQRSTDSISVWTAPGSESAPEEVSDVYDTISNTSEVAMSDYAVVQVQASGVYGYLEDANLNGSGDAGLSLELAQTNAPPNDDGASFYANDSRIIQDPENNTFFVLIDTDTTDHDIEAGQEYEATFTVGESSPYIADGDNNEENSESVSTEFSIVDSDAEFTYNGDQLILGGSNAQLSGSTSLAPGTELTLRVQSQDNSNPFLKTANAVVQQDGTFNATFDMSGIPQDTEFTASIGQPRAVNDVSEDGVVGEAPDTTSEPTETTQVTETTTTEQSTTETTTPTPDETTTTEGTTTSNDGGQPGFGIVAALIALVAAALIAVRRD